MDEERPTLREEYIRTAVSLKFGTGWCLVAIPVGSGRDAWSFMRKVARMAERWPADWPPELGAVKAD